MNAKQETTRAAATRTPLIVGVGASAGGLEACADLLERLGNVEGLAIVFVQHLEPTGNSLLVELLSRHTPMKVSELSGRTKIKAGHLYVAPPHSLLRLKNGFVSVETQSEPPHRANSIDHFFHALAGDQGELAVGVILSGSGSDGTLGLKAISDSGGLTFAQDPATAKFDSMPRSAATTGVADHVMSPAQIAAEIVAYRQHLGELNSPPSHGWRDDIGDTIPLIAEVLLKTTNHNFQHYKSSTLSRRIQRRMQLLRLSRADDYVARIREDADEARALFRELLIGVTAFFRDPEAFQSLARIVLPKLFENRTPGDCVRMWVAGCATGEEAYSLAILCREYLDHLPSRPEVQIFATDIDERALQIARNGSYPSGIEEQVSNDRLKRFFVKRGKRYTIVKEIRDMVLFSAHNLISDPPFSRQDLICCRNLLIYLGPHLQKKLIPLFHYALRPAGFLFLGPSESITSHTELFRPCDARFRISQRKGTAIGSTRPLPLIPSNTSGPIGDPNASVPTVELSEIRQRIILDEFAPKAVIIDETGQVLNASDNLQKYLRLGEGDFQNNILKMADRGLRMGLRAAISEAIKTRRRVQHEDLSIHDGEFVQRVMLTVQPMPRLGEDEGLFIVVFHDVGLPFHRGSDLVAEPGNSHRDADSIIAQMERELESTREDLDRTMQEMEAANEELKSSNEELLSMNEELQSANEELETSKEEIRENSDAMARINNDLENLLRSTQIATIFLDQEYLIRGFTPAVTVIYDLIATDIGRPLSLFVPHVENMPPLPDQETLYERGVMEDTILAENGRSYIRRVLPYRTHVGDTEGIVVTFTDVTELRESEQRLSLALDATSDGAWDWNISTGELVFSDRWLASLGYASDEVAAHVEFRDSIVHPDDRPRKQELLERHFRGDTETYYCEKRLRMKSGHYRWTLARGRVVQFDDAGQPLRMVGTDTDISERMHAQLELEARERQLKTITDAIPPLIAFVDREQRYQFVNAAYARDWKCDIADLIGRKVQDVLGPQNFEEVRPHLEAALQGQRVTFEFTFRVPNSRELLYKEVTYVPQPNADGSIDGCHVVVMDITERRRWAQELADREAHLRRVIDNMLGFVGVLANDGTLLEANAAATNAAGIQRDDVIGKKFWDCYWWNYDPAIASRLRESISRAAAGEVVRYDVAVRMMADRIMTIDFMLVPVIGQDGTVEFIVPSGIDISDRKASADILRRTLDGLLAFVATCNLEGHILACNTAALEWGGLQVADVLGKVIWQCDWWQHDENVRGEIQRAVERAAKGEVVRLTTTYRDATRELRYMDFQIAPMSDQQGRIAHLVLSGVDVTTQRETEESLRKARELAEAANESKSAFLANMSHEIRTPMTAILGYADLVSECVQEAETREYLTIIKRNGDFLLDIINDVLDLSKIEANKFEIARQRFAPHRLVEDVRSIMEIRADENHVRLSVIYENAIPDEIESDPKRLKQILVNLVGNAVKFTPNGSVRILVKYVGGDPPKLQFSVVDSGIGISREQQERLFQPFQQGDSNVNREFGGTGLGLTISKRLVEMLGGEISVQSEVGKGSTFTATIVARQVPGAGSIQPGTEFSDAEPIKVISEISLTCHVLVVDDRREIRFLTRKLLNKAGATVSEAEDGSAAVALVQSAMSNGSPPDLILLDMQMPRMDGYETAIQLRKLGFTSPIVALTADAMQGDMARCIESGCNAYVSKPIDRDTLIGAVHRFTTQ